MKIYCIQTELQGIRITNVFITCRAALSWMGCSNSKTLDQKPVRLTMKHYPMMATECQDISKHCAEISVALKGFTEPESAERAATAIIRTMRRAGPRSACTSVAGSPGLEAYALGTAGRQ
jgi:hypothetical protein